MYKYSVSSAVFLALFLSAFCDVPGSGSSEAHRALSQHNVWQNAVVSSLLFAGGRLNSWIDNDSGLSSERFTFSKHHIQAWERQI